jgi:ankyrin repeat protein
LAVTGRWTEVKQAIELGANIHARCKMLNTLLHYAFGLNWAPSDVVEWLIARGCNLHAHNIVGDAPFHNAASIGKTWFVRLLIEEHGVDVDLLTKFNETALHDAIRCGHLETIQYLLSKRANVECLSYHGCTPLIDAVRYSPKNERIVALLLDHGAAIDARDNGQLTALHFATTKAIAQLLLDRGADIESRGGPSNRRPLHSAALSGVVEVATLLLERGCELKSRDDLGNTAMHYAAQSSSIAMVQLMEKHQFDRRVKNTAGRTPLHSAALAGRVDVLRYLMGTVALRSFRLTLALGLAVGAHRTTVVKFLLTEAGLSVHQRWGSTTLLHHAVRHNGRETAQLLINYGHRVDVLDADGRQPIHIAVMHNVLSDCLEALFHSGANLNARDRSKNTPLMLAVAARKTSTIRWLVLMDADVNCVNAEGQTAFSLALKDCPSQAKLLASFGVRY